MTDRMKVLVTNAENNQGLAVIRGLGIAGVPVVACGTTRRGLGFYSKYASEKHVYTSPFTSKSRFVGDILRIARDTRPDVILAGESTLVVLDEARAEVEQYTKLGAPRSEILRCAVDKAKTIELAERVGVPVPRTARGSSTADVLEKAAALRFPVAVKPQGHKLYGPTTHALNFKVRYARNLEELEQVLRPFGEHSGYPLVQEFAPGVGTCVGAVFRDGEPVTMLAYVRARNWPLSGGISTLRRTIALDERLRSYVTALLGELRWRGVAMVEFKHDERDDSYTLMEINGRFQASVALSLDAGVNLPYLTACVHTGRPVEGPTSYRIGVEERWLRGDLFALGEHLLRGREETERLRALHDLPSKSRAIWEFARDFRPRMRYDEFKRYDWKPGVVECASIVASVVEGAGRAVARRSLRGRAQHGRIRSDPVEDAFKTELIGRAEPVRSDSEPAQAVRVVTRSDGAAVG
ncbi:MAG: ATP-grasp domain-containing protein [Gemmatimonadaceae bacterium]